MILFFKNKSKNLKKVDFIYFIALIYFNIILYITKRTDFVAASLQIYVRKNVLISLLTSNVQIMIKKYNVLEALSIHINNLK
jgi:hypothetical protein